MSPSKILLLATVACLSGCASEIVRYPIELSNTKSLQSKNYVASQTALIHLDSGYERTINSGTEFVEFGMIKQGKVLKPTNAVFTIEGAHTHEAYLVLDNDRIVGFYLPVEKAFSPLSRATILPIQEKEPVK